MDKLILKLLWLSASTCIFISFTCAQNARILPRHRPRKLPTVIITREHLRQRQNSYGAHGDTAAEFVVSAGIDTSKNSAVRIRRIGHRRENSTHGMRPNRLNFPFVNDTRRTSATGFSLNPQFRTPSFHNPDERNSIQNTYLSIDRRYHLNEADQNLQAVNRPYHLNENEQRVRSPNGGFYHNINRNPVIPDRTFYQYRPPIFVPNYQQIRRSDPNGRIPGEANRRVTNVVIPEEQRHSFNANEQIYPIVNVKYSSSSVSSSTSQKQHSIRSNANNNENTNKKIPFASRNNNKQDIYREPLIRNNHPIPRPIIINPSNNTRYYPKENSSRNSNNNDQSYLTGNNLSSYVPKPHDEKLDKENIKASTPNESKIVNESSKVPNVPNKVKDEEQLKEEMNNSDDHALPRNSVVESTDPDKNGLAEIPQSQSNVDKIREFQTRLIRKPSLVLRDQITVNELPRKSNRPRYGPRSLEHTDENVSLSRRKRETNTSGFKKHSPDIPLEDDKLKQVDHNRTPDFHSSNGTENNNISISALQRQGRYNSEKFGSRLLHGRINESSGSNSPISHKESRVVPVYEMFSDGTFENSDDTTESDIMSFSDFLASPMAEKIRLERQFYFKNENKSNENTSTEDLSDEDERVEDSRSFKNNSMTYLKNLLTARILDGFLNVNNTGNNTKFPKIGRSSDGINPAEQRGIGIMVTPFDDQDNDDPYSKPVIRILKGRIVSLPDLPQELIPIIMGTYKPTYTQPEETMYHDDAKLTENILDNAIYKLLQNDDLLNLQPIVRKSPRPIAYKVSRKSPSTNYVGSLKTNEPMGKPKFVYKPSEWSLGPRCDRLTEEICLDDSDYPSSAIMSSIYKDKAKFDMMYAEVKVHESQVEGLSRQQETAYSFDNYYGSYPQTAGSGLMPREYGSNGGFVCPSEVHYAKPHRAKNRKGEWKVVVNVGEYTQTVRMEKCLSSGNPCKYVVNRMQSTCAQVYSYHRLLVFSKEKGLHIDVFRVPAACTCYLRTGQNGYTPTIAASSPYLMRPNPYEEYGGHVETAPSPQIHAEGPSGVKDKKKTSFGNTLWAILGGGQQASALAQQPQFLDEVQKQISWTQQLNKFPHIMKQISPNQVLKQLLEEDEEDNYSIRRQRIRKKHPLDQLTSAGFVSPHMPIGLPLPPPPPPPPSAVIPRRPVISIAPVDQKRIFSMSPDSQSKIIAISSNSEPTKIFSLTKDPTKIKNSVRPNNDSGQRNIYAILSQQPLDRMSGYKVQPGMYPPKSENVQIPESSLLPVAPQFSSHPDNPMKAIMKPMRGSNKNIVEDEDLVAAEKSVGDSIHAYAVESITDTRAVEQDDNDSKINFSYHPILEYLDE